MLSTTQRVLMALGLLGMLAGLTWAGLQLGRPRRPEPTFATSSAAATQAVKKPELLQRQPLPPLFPDLPPASCVLVLSGQMLGYLQPCGCARPQVGGLERRFELIKRILHAGPPVSGADLGDLAPHQSGAQARSKYEIAVRSLAKMPYVALGMGLTEFHLPLEEALGLAQNYMPPYVLLANLQVPDDRFPDQFRRWTVDEPHTPADGAAVLGRVMGGTLAPGLVSTFVTALASGRPRIGYVGLVGASLIAVAREKDPALEFIPPAAVVPEALAALARQGAGVRVLLFQGNAAEAQALHAAHPGAFHVILARADGDIAPRLPTRLEVTGQPPTLLVNVGHKGKSTGLVHVRTGGAAPELHYQMVELVEELELPDHQTNPVREVMRDYVLGVYQNRYLTQTLLKPHPHQMLPEMSAARFVGAARCQECHPGAHQVWKGSKHSHAYQALVDYGRPTAELIRRGEVPLQIGRQHDPECAVCHVTGFGFQGGFIDAEQTPHLLGNQCENCHGPASLHVENPKEPKYSRPLRLSIGSKETEQKCRSCHDVDNDPHFDLEKYWPKIKHPRY
jgi:hypothetical protein